MISRTDKNNHISLTSFIDKKLSYQLCDSLLKLFKTVKQILTADYS